MNTCTEASAQRLLRKRFLAGKKAQREKAAFSSIVFFWGQSMMSLLSFSVKRDGKGAGKLFPERCLATCAISSCALMARTVFPLLSDNACCLSRVFCGGCLRRFYLLLLSRRDLSSMEYLRRKVRVCGGNSIIAYNRIALNDIHSVIYRSDLFWPGTTNFVFDFFLL